MKNMDTVKIILQNIGYIEKNPNCLSAKKVSGIQNFLFLLRRSFLVCCSVVIFKN